MTTLIRKRIPAIVHGGGPVDIKSAVKAAAGSGGNKKSATQTTQDTLTQVTNRYIASLQTPAQQAAQQNSLINASLAASKAATNAAYDQQSKTLLQQQARAHQYAMALGSLRDASGDQVTADYRNAAHDIQGLGTGLTGTIADSQQATANDAAQRIAAATGGHGVAQGLDTEGLKNIAQYTGVTMPSTDLYEEAASQAAQARLAQDMRGQQVENLASDYGTKVTDLASERAGKLAELAATRPSLYQSAITAAQSGNRSDLATIISALALQNQTAKVPSEISKNTATGKAATASGQAATTRAGVAVGKETGIIMVNGKPTLAGNHYWVGPGKTKTAVIPKNQMLDPRDPTGHTLKKNPAAFAPASSGKTPADKTQALISTWSKTLDDDMFSEGSPLTHDISDAWEVAHNYAKPSWKPTMSYAKAFSTLISRVPPTLRTNPQMIANINATLRRGGYTVPTKVTKTTVKVKPKTAGDYLPPSKGLFG